MQVNFSGKLIDLTNIGMDGEHMSGKSSLLKIIAADCVERNKLELKVFTDEDVPGWQDLCEKLHYESHVVDCSRISCWRLLLDEYEAAFVRKVKQNTLVVVDCYYTFTPSPNLVQLLDDWRKRCKSSNNYLMIASRYAMIRDMAGIVIDTYMGDDGKPWYKYIVHDTGECAQNPIGKLPI